MSGALFASFEPPTVDVRFPCTWYVRCRVCLAVGTVPGPSGNYFHDYAAKCSACDSPVDVLGRVKAEVLIHGERCPCDDRCTSARGPLCSCKCGGKNHGAGLRCNVDNVAGSVPRVRFPSTGDVLRARAVVARVAELKARLTADPDYTAKLAGSFLSGPAFSRYREVAERVGDLHRIMGLRSHSGREKALARFEKSGVL